MAGFDVGHGFVHEALTGLVDDHRAGELRSFKANQGRPTSGTVGPPTRRLPSFECGAELFGGDDAVAGVGLGADRPPVVMGARWYLMRICSL